MTIALRRPTFGRSSEPALGAARLVTNGGTVGERLIHELGLTMVGSIELDTRARAGAAGRARRRRRALVSLRRLKGDSVVFQIMNILGAAGIALHSGTNRAWASASLNLVWIAIGIVALARRASRARQPGPA